MTHSICWTFSHALLYAVWLAEVRPPSVFAGLKLPAVGWGWELTLQAGSPVILFNYGKSGKELGSKNRSIGSLACSSWLIQLSTSCWGALTLTVGWALPHQLLVKKMSHRLAHRATDGNVFSIEVPSSQLVPSWQTKTRPAKWLSG